MNGDTHQYEDILIFIKELERLKDITRTAWTTEGRRESVAEHSWRLALFALALEEYLPELDINRVVRMCLVHDLGEAYEGDVSAKIEVDQEKKLFREEKAICKLLEPLPRRIREKLAALWQEYNAGETKEAKAAKALDKMETIIQHNQGKNPPDFDYAFNLGYGREHALHDPVLKALREIVDRDTRDKTEEPGMRCKK